MWSFEHSVVAEGVSRAQVWRVWTDLEHWPVWDTAAEWVRPGSAGPMAVGQTYVLKPRQGPRAKGTFTRVDPGRGFADVTRLPLCKLGFDHRVEDLAEGRGVRITHRVTLAGPMTFLFRRALGERIARGIPDVMRQLVTVAAKATPAEGIA